MIRIYLIFLFSFFCFSSLTAEEELLTDSLPDTPTIFPTENPLLLKQDYECRVDKDKKGNQKGGENEPFVNIDHVEPMLSAECEPLTTIAGCVNVCSGRFFQVEKDLLSNAIDPISLIRTYDSGNHSETSLGYGFGLRFPLWASNTACKSAISQARMRIGKEPIIMLYDEIVQPIAREKTEGAYYKNRLLVAIDGSKLDAADTEENTNYFGKQKYGTSGGIKGEGAFPLMRFVSLIEVGTHVIFETVYSKFSTSEYNLGKMILEKVKPNMLVLADRMYFTYENLKLAVEKGADLLWRIKKNTKLKIIEAFPDGSCLG